MSHTSLIVAPRSCSAQLEDWAETETHWRNGPFKLPSRLIFGQTYEDSAIELRAFQPHSRVFCIGGAGDLARTLAEAGHSVTAVDINPAQIAYAQSRAAGGSWRSGGADRLLAFGRMLAPLVGWSRRTLEVFLAMCDTAKQVEFWDRHLDTSMWRVLADTLLAPRLLGLVYASPLVESLPRDFGEQLRARMRRGFAVHPNSGNPYAAQLFLGVAAKSGRQGCLPLARNHIEFTCCDAAEYLEGCPCATFDGFALSNIGDGASPTYMRRLHAAVRRAAAPGAVVVSRSFTETTSACNQAALDRSLIWGTVEVQPCCIC